MKNVMRDFRAIFNADEQAFIAQELLSSPQFIERTPQQERRHKAQHDRVKNSYPVIDEDPMADLALGVASGIAGGAAGAATTAGIDSMSDDDVKEEYKTKLKKHDELDSAKAMRRYMNDLKGA